MPGICGIVQLREGATNCATILGQMVQCMVHESFYEVGTYCSAELGVNVCWSTFKGKASDLQPVWNQARDIALFFSGEEYSKAELPDASDQHRLQHIVERYETEGAGFVASLNGIFSGLLIDLRKPAAFLFNDRYGLGRIYYYQTPDAFYFATEAKAILRVCPETRELDRRSLGEFFSMGAVLQNRSLFKGISLLPSGTICTFGRNKTPALASYFDAEVWEAQERLGCAEFYDRLRETFPRVLQRYLGGSKKIGISLTGGVDSRLILAWAGATPGFLPCYTFGGRYREPNDVRLARRVAQICRQPHQVIRVAADFLRDFPQLAERTVYLSDGVMDVSAAADLFVNKVAREVSPVRLTGNYGGEILRELVAFRPQAPYEAAFNKGFLKDIDAASETYATERRGSALSFVAFKQVPWHHYSRLSVERSQLVVRSPYLDNELVQLAYQTPPEWIGKNEPALRLIADGNPKLDRIATDRALVQKPIPLLSRAMNLLQEFTFKAEYAYDYGMPQPVARVDAALRHLHLERLFLGRHKFHHFRIWYRDELSSYLKAVLLDRRSLHRAYLNRKTIEEMVRTHTAGYRNYTQEFHRLLTVELLQRQLIELN